MTRRPHARSLVLALAALMALFVALRAPSVALGQGMDRSGLLDIHDEHERSLFLRLQCVCGCPRESIGTCSCGQSAEYRAEARALMAKGLSDEEIITEWTRRYGPAARMVPPNEGLSRLLYIAPLFAIVGMAAFAVTMLLRFRKHAEEKAAAAPPPAKPGQKRDEYDDKLDEELKQLDDE